MVACHCQNTELMRRAKPVTTIPTSLTDTSEASKASHTASVTHLCQRHWLCFVVTIAALTSDSGTSEASFNCDNDTACHNSAVRQSNYRISNVSLKDS